MPAGGVLTAGEPVVTLYDPAEPTFQGKTSVEDLRRLRLGMAATVDAEGLGEPIDARLDRVVPRVGSGSGSSAH